jgi:hypothetical protein
MTRNTLLLLAGVALLGACGGDNGTGPGTGPGTGGGAGGNYSATVSGDITSSLSGKEAVFGGGKGVDNNEVFAIVTGFDTTATSNGIAFLRQNQTRPGTGTYQIGTPTGADTSTVFTAIGIINAGNVLLVAESGSLKITSSSDGKMEGSFQFTGSAADVSAPTTEKAVTVTGTFSAVHLTGVPSFAVTSFAVHGLKR